MMKEQDEAVNPYLSVRFFTDMSELRSVIKDMRERYVVMMICRQGSLHVDMGDSSLTLHAQQLLLLSNVFGRGRCTFSPDFSGIALLFDPYSLDDLLYSCLRSVDGWLKKMKYVMEHPIMSLNQRQQRLLELLMEVHRTYNQHEQTLYRQQIRQSFAQVVSYEVMSWIDECCQEADLADTAVARGTDIFRRFFALLEQTRGRERAVKWYAEQLSITPKYLSAVCKKETTRTALELITEMALHEIRHQLLASDDSIKEIAYRMNFPSFTFFCKYFRQHFGMSPMDFRQSYRV